MRRMAAGMAIAWALVACGGDGGGGGPAPSVQVLADRMATKGLTCNPLAVETVEWQREPGAREQASCELGDDTVTIVTYDTNKARDSANAVAKESGGIAVLGDRWAVRVSSPDAAERVKAALGGKIT